MFPKKEAVVSARIHDTTKHKLVKSGYNAADAIEWFVHEYYNNSPKRKAAIQRDLLEIKLNNLKKIECDVQLEIEVIEKQLEDLGDVPLNDEEIIPKCGGYVKIRVFYHVRKDIKKCILSIGLREISGTTLIDLPTQMTILPFPCSEGEHYADCIITKLPLTGGNYRMSLWSECDNSISDFIDNIRYTVADADFYGQGREMPSMFHGKIVLCDHQWVCSK